MAPKLPLTPAIPQNSLVLVTGASGFIASHIVAELLRFGYNVRGTVRSDEKVKSTSVMFEPFTSTSVTYEPFIVADFVHDGAFTEAVKGCSAVIHAASVMSFSSDPNEVIPQTVAGATSAIKAALREQSVKRFVYTSSSTAATMPKPGKKFAINKDMWDDEAVEAAWKPGPYEPERAFTVYAASKTEAERAVWKIAKSDGRPDLIVNCVLPNGNLGRILEGGSAGTTGAWVTSVYKGDLDSVKDVPPQFFIDVVDDARIHIAAAIDPDLKDERIFAFAEPFNWNDIIDSVGRAKQGFKQEHLQGQERDLSEPDNSLGAELLKKWWGQDGYKSLDQSVKENLEGV